MSMISIMYSIMIALSVDATMSQPSGLLDRRRFRQMKTYEISSVTKKNMRDTVEESSTPRINNIISSLTRHLYNGACVAEEKEEYYADSLLNSYNEPDWFLDTFSDPLGESKNFSSYVKCNEDFTCDYSDLSEAAKGACHFHSNDGAFYTTDINITCLDDEVSFQNKKFPLCVSANCTLNEHFFDNNPSVFFESICENGVASYEYSFNREPSPINEECSEEVKALTSASGGGKPFFVVNAGFEFDFDYCKLAEDSLSQSCDFIKAVKAMKKPCEDEGGIMYKISDIYTAPGGYYGDDQPVEIIFENLPLCIGSSCNAKSYIEELVVPSAKWWLEGDFITNGIHQYSSTYDLTSYSAVQDEDERKFLLRKKLVKGKKSEDISKQCTWLESQSDGEKKKICTSKTFQVFSASLGPASNICTQACAPFCRQEKINAKFLYDRVGDGSNVSTKQCKWLQNKKPEKIASICNMTIYVENSIYRDAANTCTNTCNTC